VAVPRRLFSDARFAIRALRRAPVVTTAALLTLALGVGLNTAIFSVVQAVLVDQLPYRSADRLVAVSLESSDPRGRVPGWVVDEWGRRGRTMTRFAAYDDSQLLLRDAGRTDVLRGMRVSAGFFDTLGVEVAAGRGLRPEDDTPRANVLVITHELWASRFGADAGVIGRVVDTDGVPYRVIGILPPGFQPLRMSNAAERPQFFAPLGLDPARVAARDTSDVRVIGRLAPGATAAQAQSELGAIARDLYRQSTGQQAREVPIRVQPMLDRLVGPIRFALWLLLAAVSLVLLMACANVASLQLVRATERTREFAVRGALGASRGTLAGQVMVESLLIALLGGAAGLLVARAALAAILHWAPKELARLDDVRIDERVLLFTLSVSVATAAISGLAPAWAAARADVNDVLKRSAGFAGRAFGKRLRGGLVVVDIALAFLLVLATGLLGRSYGKLLTLDAGFDPGHVLTLTPVIGSRPFTTSREGLADYYRRLMERVVAVPGVSAAGLISNVPLSNIEPAPVRTDADAQLADADVPTADIFIAGGDYFRALRIPLRRGRLIGDRDGAPDAAAVVVSESFAARRFTGDPIGQRLRIRFAGRTQSARIVGIVGDVRYDRLERAPGQAIYVPLTLYPFHYTRLVVRTSGEETAQRAILSSIHAFDPLLGVFHVQPMTDYVDSALAERRFPLALLASFGTLALALAGIGLYGVVSHALVLRRPEFGVRVALGARPSQILALVLRQALVLVAGGLAAGVLAALAVSRILASAVFGIAAIDPPSVALTAAALGAVTVAATLLPARAAIRIDPVAALRSD
jgi:putative ABC transport system permease protein